MNAEYVDALIELSTFALWVSFIVVPAIAATKANIPSVSGWKTVAVALGVGWFVAGLLTKPTSVTEAIDATLIGFIAALISVGGDSYLFRLIRKIKLPQLEESAAKPSDPATESETKGS